MKNIMNHEEPSATSNKRLSTCIVFLVIENKKNNDNQAVEKTPWRENTDLRSEILTHFRPMFHLCRNQVPAKCLKNTCGRVTF